MTPDGYLRLFEIVGALPATVEFAEKYFYDRHIFLDCRGPLTINKDSRWGYNITVITQSHYMGSHAGAEGWGAVIDRPVTVDRNAWICSNALLYNCHIGEGAVVGLGAVVRSQDVAPYVMVAGNPARVIARMVEGAWVYESERYEVLK